VAEFVESTASNSPATGTAGSGGRGMRSMVEEFSPGAAPRVVGGGNQLEQFGPRGGARALPEAVMRGLRSMESTGIYDSATPKDPAPATPPADAPPTAETPSAVAPATSTVPAASPPAAPAAPATAATGSPAVADPAPAVAPADPDRIERSAYERALEQNKKLLVEMETMRTARAARELSPREKALHEAESVYFDDPARAIRQFLAVAMGVDDPKSKDIDEELSGLYQDLTATEIGVPLSETQKARREAARTRQLLARDKRERSAEIQRAATPTEDPEAKKHAGTIAAIGSELTKTGSDGQSLAARFPLTMGLSEYLHGVKPEELLWRTIKEGVGTGEIDKDMSDDKIVEYAGKKLEALHESIADRIGKARPQPQQPNSTTTAQPTKANDATAQPSGSTREGIRTITSASASVAPATPPATSPEQPAMPKFKSDRERLRWIAEKHFGRD
jgi:hypothetical protein